MNLKRNFGIVVLKYVSGILGSVIIHSATSAIPLSENPSSASISACVLTLVLTYMANIFVVTQNTTQKPDTRLIPRLREQALIYYPFHSRPNQPLEFATCAIVSVAASRVGVGEGLSPLKYQRINLPFKFLDSCACLVKVFFMCQRRL